MASQTARLEELLEGLVVDVIAIVRPHPVGKVIVAIWAVISLCKTAS
jgi:hypothetical protein